METIATRDQHTACPEHNPCPSFAALATECADDALTQFYARRLLRVGWAGIYSRVEREYVRRHRSEARQRAAAARARSLPAGATARSQTAPAPDAIRGAA